MDLHTKHDKDQVKLKITVNKIN